MKLLFDQNLPSSFETLFSGLFAGSRHVKSIGLARAADRAIWDYARDNGFSIISKDADFHHLSFLLGAPPKVVWLRCGNASVAALEALLRRNTNRVEAFLREGKEALLVVE